MKEVIGAQGEVIIVKIDELPKEEFRQIACMEDGSTIVAHSESGHHHVLLDGDVMERLTGVPTGMKILYAIVEHPTEFVHAAPGPHHGYELDPGLYEFRISREYDPFGEQARTVMD